jgi:hypothetical protein
VQCPIPSCNPGEYRLGPTPEIVLVRRVSKIGHEAIRYTDDERERKGKEVKGNMSYFLSGNFPILMPLETERNR